MGLVDDNVVVTFVGRNFVKADIPYLTRFGEQKTINIKPGQHKITCIGLTFGLLLGMLVNPSRSPLSSTIMR